MSETENETPPDPTSNFFNAVVAISVAVIALAGSLITKIQSDASTLSSAAANDEQIYYYEAMGEQISGDANTNYEFGTIYQLWDEYNLLAIFAEKGGDASKAASYRKLRDDLLKNSALLSSDYFDAATGQVDLVAYKENLYGLHVIELEEMQSAAAAVSDAWGEKDSTYVLQLTLLAVAGFLLGLSLMTRSNIARIVFTTSGIPMVIILSIWAYTVWRQPVYDLRKTGAIPYFAEGVSLIEQKNWKAALTPLNKAIELAGEEEPYGHAYLHRAQANAELGNFEAAVSDYQSAIEMGEDEPNVIGSLVWALFQTGKFHEAINAGQTALEDTPNNLWLQLRVGMALLANGDIESAKLHYQDIVKLASAQAADKRALGDDPSEIWWQLNDAAFQLGRLTQLLDSDQTNSPVKNAINDKENVSAAAQELASLLNEASVSLQYAVTKSDTRAIFKKPEISFSSTPDQLYIYKVSATFQYTGLEKGQLLTIKVSRNGIEDPSWTYTTAWDKASSGKFTLVLTPAYADVYLVLPGVYEVSIYVNGNKLQQETFSIGEDRPENGDFIFSDMLDNFDFFNMDIFDTDDELAEEEDIFDPEAFYDSAEEYDLYFYEEGSDLSNENDEIIICESPDDPACSDLNETDDTSDGSATDSENNPTEDPTDEDTGEDPENESSEETEEETGEESEEGTGEGTEEETGEGTGEGSGEESGPDPEG